MTGPGRSSKAGLHKWAAEVAAQGSFSAPHGPEDAGASLGGLPVPHLVIGTKADISGRHDMVADFTNVGESR